MDPSNISNDKDNENYSKDDLVKMQSEQMLFLVSVINAYKYEVSKNKNKIFGLEKSLKEQKKRFVIQNLLFVIFTILLIYFFVSWYGIKVSIPFLTSVSSESD